MSVHPCPSLLHLSLHNLTVPCASLACRAVCAVHVPPSTSCCTSIRWPSPRWPPTALAAHAGLRGIQTHNTQRTKTPEGHRNTRTSSRTAQTLMQWREKGISKTFAWHVVLKPRGPRGARQRYIQVHLSGSVGPDSTGAATEAYCYGDCLPCNNPPRPHHAPGITASANIPVVVVLESYYCHRHNQHTQTPHPTRR